MALPPRHAGYRPQPRADKGSPPRPPSGSGGVPDEPPLELSRPRPLHAVITQDRRWGPDAWRAQISDSRDRATVFGWTEAQVERRAHRRMAKMQANDDRRRRSRREISPEEGR